MQRITAILMSIFLLLSSSGLTYAQHFCGEYEMMAEITLGEKSLSCGMAMESPGCDDEEDDHSCCDNEYTNIDTDDTFSLSSTDLDFRKALDFAIISSPQVDEVIFISSEKDYFKDYRPPPLDKDFQVLYETFLI